MWCNPKLSSSVHTLFRGRVWLAQPYVLSARGDGKAGPCRFLSSSLSLPLLLLLLFTFSAFKKKTLDRLVYLCMFLSRTSFIRASGHTDTHNKHLPPPFLPSTRSSLHVFKLHICLWRECIWLALKAIWLLLSVWKGSLWLGVVFFWVCGGVIDMHFEVPIHARGPLACWLMPAWDKQEVAKQLCKCIKKPPVCKPPLWSAKAFRALLSLSVSVCVSLSLAFLPFHSRQERGKGRVFPHASKFQRH